MPLTPHEQESLADLEAALRGDAPGDADAELAEAIELARSISLTEIGLNLQNLQASLALKRMAFVALLNVILLGWFWAIRSLVR